MNEPTKDELRSESISQIQAFDSKLIVPFTSKLAEESYTLIAIPNDRCVQQIHNFIQELKTIDSSQLYYLPNMLHLTLVGEIPIIVDQKLFIKSAQSAVKSVNIKFALETLGTNKHAVSAIGYPEGFSVHDLRETIRSKLNIDGTDYTKHSGCYEYLGWINFMRYLQIPSGVFVEKLKTNITRGFGIMTPQRFEIRKVKTYLINDGNDELVYSF